MHSCRFAIVVHYPLRIFSAYLAVTTPIKRGRKQHAAQLSSSASSIYEADLTPSFLPYCREFRPILVDGAHRVSSSLSRVSINPHRQYTTGSPSRVSTDSHRQSTSSGQLKNRIFTRNLLSTCNKPKYARWPTTPHGGIYNIGGFAELSYAMLIGGLRHQCSSHSSVSFSVSLRL